MTDIADLINSDNELAGEINFELTDDAIFDAKVKDVTIFYKLVGDARFKLFRSSAMELVFVHLTEDWMRQAKIALNNVDCSRGIAVKLSWNQQQDTMWMHGLGDEKKDGFSVQAVQIDN